MKTKWFLFLAFFVFSFSIFLSGCYREERVTKHVPYVEQWLNNPICDPPCWENITPGITMAQEGYDLLIGLPEVLNVKKPRETIDERIIVSWDMKGCEGYSYGTFLTDEFPDGKIESIFLTISCADDNTKLTEVINAFGNPDYTWPKTKEIECTQKILYIEKGMLIDVYKEKYYPFREKDYDLAVAGVLFFEPQKDFQTTIDKLGYSDGPEIKVWQSIDEDPCTDK